mmetsp:Transcript_9977/g.25392  ORF Transcript_9977/g.25392 Transcript_9977/m.25392 type:complete len:698 (-) Transcript_9977:275-2368(-)
MSDAKGSKSATVTPGIWNMVPAGLLPTPAPPSTTSYSRTYTCSVRSGPSVGLFSSGRMQLRWLGDSITRVESPSSTRGSYMICTPAKSVTQPLQQISTSSSSAMYMALLEDVEICCSGWVTDFAGVQIMYEPRVLDGDSTRVIESPSQRNCMRPLLKSPTDGPDLTLQVYVREYEVVLGGAGVGSKPAGTMFQMPGVTVADFEPLASDITALQQQRRQRRHLAQSDDQLLALEYLVYGVFQRVVAEGRSYPALTVAEAYGDIYALPPSSDGLSCTDYRAMPASSTTTQEVIKATLTTSLAGLDTTVAPTGEYVLSSSCAFARLGAMPGETTADTLDDLVAYFYSNLNGVADPAVLLGVAAVESGSPYSCLAEGVLYTLNNALCKASGNAAVGDPLAESVARGTAGLEQMVQALSYLGVGSVSESITGEPAVFLDDTIPQFYSMGAVKGAFEADLAFGEGSSALSSIRPEPQFGLATSTPIYTQVIAQYEVSSNPTAAAMVAGATERELLSDLVVAYVTPDLPDGEITVSIPVAALPADKSRALYSWDGTFPIAEGVNLIEFKAPSQPGMDQSSEPIMHSEVVPVSSMNLGREGRGRFIALVFLSDDTPPPVSPSPPPPPPVDEQGTPPGVVLPPPPPPPSSGGVPIGLIVGPIIAGLVICAVVGFLFYRRRRSRMQMVHPGPATAMIRVGNRVRPEQ